MNDSEQEEPRKVKVTVKDKRRIAAEAQVAEVSQSSPEVDVERAASPAPVSEPDYLAELQRERADFENYRKRMMREVASSGERAKALLAEKLLPVLDNFERAISHGEGGEGVALVFRELKTALESEGLEEVPAEGEVFDPTVHEAVMSVDDDSVEQPTVTEVSRRGSRFGDRLVRAAMVVVARPPEGPAPAEDAEDSEDAEE